MQKNKSWLPLFLLAILVFWSSCASTIYVAPKQADCSGVSDQKCYLIRKSPEENWVLQNSDIDGLYYEPGFSYKIKVKRERVKNPPADGASFKTVLVEVYEKTDVTDDLDIEDLAKKEWKLEFLKQDGIEVGIEKQIPTLKFDVSGKLTGTGGCNNFFGNFTMDGRTISIGELGSSRKFCEGEMDLETSFLKGLDIELRALFSEGKLILTGDGGNQMIFGYE